jgi:hypothetical protein
MIRLNADIIVINTGPNRTTSIYNACVVIIFNATGSLATLKNVLAYYDAGVVALN